MIQKLITKIKEMNSPIVVGLDPKLSFIPNHIKDDAFETYGKNSKGVAEAFYTYNKRIIDQIYDLVPSVKPQVAMYEQFGIEGMIAYEKTVNYAKEKGLVVIGDIKRGDIASTAEAYAVGHLGHNNFDGKIERGFDSDFITINPYMGYDTIKPFLDVCKTENKGLFVLVKTSNPSSGDFQDLKVGEEYLYERVAKKVDEWGKEHMGEDYSYVGAVVGATYPEIGKRLRDLMPNAYFLVPGYGAQGGQAKDMVHYFNKDGLGAIVNSSRGIIAAYQNSQYAEFGAKGFDLAAREAVKDMIKALEDALA
jgi:orotidine-5'-phosphate decarboxylase